MVYKQIELTLSDSQTDKLLASFGKVVHFLEEGGSLNTKILSDLKKKLTGVISENAQLLSTLTEVSNGHKFHHVNLCHPNAEILNLPWGIAVDPISNTPLNELNRFFLSKNSLIRPPEKIIPTGGPLKILIMISSPKDMDIRGRLSYEEEERLILHAFEPLFKEGAVEIDFTENGSLEALRRKIKKNNYHILHFSGHGIFDKKREEGFLQLENDLSLKSESVSGPDFAEALLKEKHTIPLVVLSSCQTAQAHFGKGIAGVTGTLLNKGIPGVISMGLSIQDEYATSFAAHFYKQIAEKESLLEAFRYARGKIKQEEAEFIRSNRLNMVPLQYLIPNLYLTADYELVDWDKAFEPIKPENVNIIFANTTMEKSGLATEEFVGRREDLSQILPVLFDKQPLLLKGQGGIGKTTLARKILQRLLVKSPNIIPFIFNEEGKEFSLSNVQKQLAAFCLIHEKAAWVEAAEKLFADDIIQQINFLLGQIGKAYSIVLFFDNVESFQDLGTKEFTTDHQPTLKVMKYAAQNPDIFMIVTGRYPVKELAITDFEVNDVDLNDFIRKCYNLGLKNISHAQVEFLYKTIGGNFRTLGFFHKAFSQEPENLKRAFDDLTSFKEQAQHATKTALEEMARNLIFSRLWENCGEEEKKAAQLLYHFTLPVTRVAFPEQNNNNYEKTLLNLCDQTLVQVYLDRETDLLYYYMPPLVKTLLEGKVEPLPREFHEKAGRYHHYMFICVEKGNLKELEAAFWQFYHAKNKEKTEKIGSTISSFYYSRSLYFYALEICLAVEKLYGDTMPFWCENNMGNIYFRIGQYDKALPYFESALKSLEAERQLTPDEKGNKGTTLSNIGSIFYARGDYESALKYYESSLKIRREIGDKAGEGTTLNNVGEIYRVRGDYETALKYYESSLKIRREIGDKAREGTTLGNIGLYYKARGDYETALTYFESSLKICREIGDKAGEGTTLNNISLIYDAGGDYATALKYYESSLKIRREIGDKAGEGTTLSNIGCLFHDRGDYATALKYLESSLKIRREIGDKAGEGTTLNNISQIYVARGDYETALKYLESSLKIMQEIGDKAGEGTTLNNIGGIYRARGNYETALKYLESSLKIMQEIGDKAGEGSTLNNMALIEYERKYIQVMSELEMQAYQPTSSVTKKLIGYLKKFFTEP